VRGRARDAEEGEDRRTEGNNRKGKMLRASGGRARGEVERGRAMKSKCSTIKRNSAAHFSEINFTDHRPQEFA